jgi:hypothetical protein
MAMLTYKTVVLLPGVTGGMSGYPMKLKKPLAPKAIIS